MSRPLLHAYLLLLIVFIGGCGADSPELVRVPDQAAAIGILVELEEAGIRGADVEVVESQRTTAYVIRVPATELARSRKLLRTLELPRPQGSGFDELLGTASLIPTATEERARLMHAMAGEIEQTIELIDGVVAARVHLVLPNDERLTAPGESRRPSAIVLVKYREDSEPKLTGDGGDNTSPGDANWQSHLKQLVESAMQGFTGQDGKDLAPEVVVRVTPARGLDRSGSGLRDGGMSDQDTAVPQSEHDSLATRFELLQWGGGFLAGSTLLFLLLWLNERFRPKVPLLGWLRRSEVD